MTCNSRGSILHVYL